MIVLATLSHLHVSGPTLVSGDLDLLGAWGDRHVEPVSADLANVSPTQFSSLIKNIAVAWAATRGHTITGADVWIPGLGDEQAFARKSANQSFSTTAFADVDDLSFALVPNSHYRFRFVGAYTAAATTTGLQLSVSGPASPAFVAFVGKIFVTATSVAGGVGAAYDDPLAPTSSGGSTALPFEVEGTISTGSSGGPFRLRARSEVNGSAVTVLRGSFAEVAIAR